MKGYNRDQPYNDLPLLPPKEGIETKDILKKVINASRALSQLNGAITNLPNPQLFIDTIHLQEAKASSAIENIITTNDDLYSAIIADKKFDNPATKEVVSYKEALWDGLEQIKKRPFITTNLAIDLVQQIKQNTAGIRTTPGTKLSNEKDEVIYTPPTGEKIIRDKMANLEEFINGEDDLDPLIKLAIMHYQFEAIHPFSDGNGRTGRILMLLYLRITGLLDLPAIYLSEYIINNKSEYYKRLRLVTEEKDWEGWILFILEMIEWTSAKGIKRLEEIIKSMDIMSKEIKKLLPKIYSQELINVLFRLPYTKRKNLIEADLGTAKTVGNYLIELEENGFLKSVKVGKEKLYLNERLMAILEKEKPTKEKDENGLLLTNSKYHSTWKSDGDVVISISKVLVKNDVKGCGEFYYRKSLEKNEEYMVGCSGDGVNWKYYVVHLQLGKIKGPYGNPLDLNLNEE